MIIITLHRLIYSVHTPSLLGGKSRVLFFLFYLSHAKESITDKRFCAIGLYRPIFVLFFGMNHFQFISEKQILLNPMQLNTTPLNLYSASKRFSLTEPNSHAYNIAIKLFQSDLTCMHLA